MTMVKRIPAPTDFSEMSSHRRAGIDQPILGGTAQKAIARATCPVLVVARRGRAEKMAAAA